MQPLDPSTPHRTSRRPGADGRTSSNGMSAPPASAESDTSGTNGDTSGTNGGASGTGLDDAPSVSGAQAQDESTVETAAPLFPMPSELLPWDEEVLDIAAAGADAYAMETRVERVDVLTPGDAIRRGEMDSLRAGEVETFADHVAGEENVTVNGKLVERVGHSSTVVADRLETTIDGRMTVTVPGWPGNKLSGEDGVMLGGAMTDTWTGGLLIAAAMSDDLAIGAGVRITSPVDMWLNQLTGMEERPGTTAADLVMVDLCGTLFDREYGAGVHAAGVAVFSGTVYQTQRTGFWPMMRVAVGVRNLLPGAAPGTAEPAPPAPPGGPVGLGEGAMVATGAARAGAGTARSLESFQDMGRLAGSAGELEDAANVRHAEDTAGTLDELSASARLADNGMGEVDGGRHVGGLPDNGFRSPLTEAQLDEASFLPDGFNSETALGRIDHVVYGPPGGAAHGGGETLSGLIDTRTLMLEDVRTMVANKLDEMTDAGKQLEEFEELPRGADKGAGPTGLNPGVPWPGAAVEGEDARKAQLMAEVDALKSLEDAVDGGEDPSSAVPRLIEEARNLYGAEDVRTQAYVDMGDWFTDYADATKVDEKLAELDLYMLARAEILADRDPRVAIRAVLENGESGAATQAAAQTVLRNLNSRAFKLTGSVPDGLDTAGLQAVWRGRAEDLRTAASSIDTSTPQGAERANALNDLARNLGIGALDMKQGRDPRAKLLQQISALDARTFLDGADGGGEIAVLRTAIAEYADLVVDFRGATNIVGGADESGSPLVVGGGMRATAGSGTGLEAPPPYPGLPDTFGREVELLIDVPPYSPALPVSVPDEFRLLLDVEPEQVVGGVEDGATAVARLDDTVSVEDAVPAVQPRLGADGAQWPVGGAGDVADPDALGDGLRGDYQRVEVTASEDAGGETVALSEDTQAVVDGMPVRDVPEDFDWSATVDQLNSQYLEHRRGSDWRATLAYTDVLEGMRAELMSAVTDLGGNLDDYGDLNLKQLRAGVEAMLEQAEQTDDAVQARLATRFLESLDANTYNAWEDLANRADEFDAAARGTSQPLDPHIDRGKLLDWLQGRFQDALERGVTESSQAASDEATYFQQMVVALEDGRSPLAESGEEIAYMRATTQGTKADAYAGFHDELMQVMADPAFHRTAGDMGDDTYAPVAFLRPELGEVPVNVEPGLQTQAFSTAVAEPDAGVLPGGEVAGGEYRANAETINQQLGDNDFAQAPEAQPQGIERAEETEEAAQQGSRGILKNREPGGGRVNLDSNRIVNQGPDEHATELRLELWSERMVDEANAEALRNQGGYGHYMDATANLRPRWQQQEDAVGLNPYAAARVDAANQLWDAQRGVDTRAPSEWSRMPDPGGYRSWDSGARGRKSVRFGDAEVLTVFADAEDVRKARNQFRDLDAGNAIMPWWTGSGINRPTEALDLDEAVRHVPTPRGPGDRRGYPSKWRAARQPGFGRVADAPGAFPFNAREQVIADLMKGQRIEVSHLDAMHGVVDDSVRAGRVRHKEWLDMSALLRSLRYGTVLGDSRPFAQAVDWKTLNRLLDALDSSAALL